MRARTVEDLGETDARYIRRIVKAVNYTEALGRGLLFLGVLMAALDIAIVGPALPAIRTAFGVSERATAWVFTIYVLLNLVGTPLMAKLSDSFGRRSIYVLSVALFAAGAGRYSVDGLRR